MKTLGSIWRVLVGIKDFLVLCLLALFFIGVSALLSFGRPVIGVPDGGALVVALPGVLVDQASEVSPFEAASGGGAMAEVQVRDVIRALDRARDDTRIKAVMLDLDGFAGGGQANVSAVAEAIARVRSAGKPVHAWASGYGDDAWLLAAAASRIWVSPLGGVIVAGPGGSNLYFGRALEKLQIDVNVFRVGTYKSAVEPYTRASASPASKLADQALADSLWQSWQADARRLRPRADVVAYMNQLPQRLGRTGGDAAQAALAAGLVDRIGSREMFDAAMIQLVGEDDMQDWGAFRGIGLDDYVAAMGQKRGGDAVGVVYVTGNIIDGEAPRGTAGSATIVAALREALEKDSDIQALVVRIDSGGGSVTASEDIRAALAAAKTEGLPVVASFGPVAASGGYWIATAADEIFAQPATITGSIGVFAVLPSFPRALNELGINTDGVKTTPYSGEPDILAGLSPQVRQVLQIGVEDTYKRFLIAVGLARGIKTVDVDRIAQGRVWSGVDAKRLKLIDQFGGLDAAVAAAAKRAKISGDVRVVDIERPEPAWAQALKSFGRTETNEQQARDSWALAVQASRLRMLAGAQDLAFLASGRGATMQAACVECAVAGSPRPAPARRSERWLTAWLAQSAR